MEQKIVDYTISTDKQLLNYDVIYRFLSESYWASNRPTEATVKAIENSYCYGVYHNNIQIGFARVITDWATAYYLCDVYIDKAYRGQGIGTKLVEAIINDEALINLTGILGTADAHSLYEKYGFVREPERFLMRRSK